MNVAKVVAMNLKVEESTVKTLAAKKLYELEMSGKVQAIYKNAEVEQQYKEVNEAYLELKSIFSDNSRVLELLVELEDKETYLLSLVNDHIFELGYSNGMKFLHNLHKELNDDVQ